MTNDNAQIPVDGRQPQERYDPIGHINEMIVTLQEASGVPFSDKCSIDRTEMIQSLEMLRSRLPSTVKQANDIVMRAQEIIGTAREKNKKIIDEANRMYASKVNDHEITRGAREEANNILKAAEANADELRREAHLYAKDVLSKTNDSLAESIKNVQTTLGELDSALDTL